MCIQQLVHRGVYCVTEELFHVSYRKLNKTANIKYHCMRGINCHLPPPLLVLEAVLTMAVNKKQIYGQCEEVVAAGGVR